MNLENKKLMQKLIDFASKEGAESSDVIFNTGKSLSMSAQEGELDSYKVSGSKIAGIRVIKDSKVGISYTEAFDDEALKDTAKKAVENSRFGEVNEFEKIEHAVEEDLVHMGDVEPVEQELDPQAKIDLCLKLESEVRKKDERVKGVPYNGLSESSVEGHYLNSVGTFAYDFESYVSCYTSALLKEGDKNSMFYHGTVGKHYNSLDWKSCVEQSYNHSLNWLNASPLKTGKYDVIFSIDQFESLFGAFRGMFSGKRAQEKSNPMFDRLGERIGHEELSIMDMPMYTPGFFKSPFDSEGYVRADLSLVKNGVFSNLFHNSATSKYFKTDNTFRAARGAKSALGVSGTTTVIQSGSKAEGEVKSGRYFEIHNMQGLHSGLNFMSGDFSFGASGYLIEDGKSIQAVNGVTVAGNFYKMLQNINAIGNEINSSSGKSFFCPLIRFEALSVAGN
ncbi:MAG: TldD/PmbA family protein [Bacteriovoracaceae bacterium]|nr:TldD/PmbA family protein [Bacteriovoracaceae bacterium]